MTPFARTLATGHSGQRAFLRHNSKALFLFSPATESVLRKRARADHFLLTEGIGLPDRGILGMLIGERMLIAALLLALLGLRALLLAHRYSRRQLPGAMP